MGSVERLEPRVIEALNAERDAVNASVHPCGEVVFEVIPRIGFYGDFGLWCHTGNLPDKFECGAQIARWVNGWRAPAYVDAGDAPRFEQRAVLAHIEFKRAVVRREVGTIADLVGIEIAVWTLASAPWEMEIDAERRRLKRLQCPKDLGVSRAFLWPVSVLWQPELCGCVVA